MWLDKRYTVIRLTWYDVGESFAIVAAWDWRYQAGAELALTRHWRIEPYYARRENQHAAAINRIGFIVKTYS